MHFSSIAVVEMGSMATLDQLRVRPVKGRRQSIRVRDPETFFDELESALNAYRDAHPEEGFNFQFTGRVPAEADAGVIDVEPGAVTDADVAQPDEAAGELQEAATEATTEEPASATEAAGAEPGTIRPTRTARSTVCGRSGRGRGKAAGTRTPSPLLTASKQSNKEEPWLPVVHGYLIVPR